MWKARSRTGPAGPTGSATIRSSSTRPTERTFGEVSDAEKTAVSHRGQAMRALRAYLAGGLHLPLSWPVATSPAYAASRVMAETNSYWIDNTPHRDSPH